MRCLIKLRRKFATFCNRRVARAVQLVTFIPGCQIGRDLGNANLRIMKLKNLGFFVFFFKASAHLIVCSHVQNILARPLILSYAIFFNTPGSEYFLFDTITRKGASFQNKVLNCQELFSVATRQDAKAKGDLR